MKDKKKAKDKLSKVVSKALYSTGKLVSNAKLLKSVNVKAGWKTISSATHQAWDSTVNVSGKVGRGINRGLVRMGESFKAGYRSADAGKKLNRAEKTAGVKRIPKKRTVSGTKKMIKRTGDDRALEREVDRIADKVDPV